MDQAKNTVLEKAKVRAGMLAAIRLGLINELIEAFKALPKDEQQRTGANEMIWNAWTHTLATYKDHGGDPKVMIGVLEGSGDIRTGLGASGYTGKGDLKDVIGADAFVLEIEKPLVAAGLDPNSITVSEALAAVVLIIHVWGGMQSSISMMKALEQNDLQSLGALIKPESAKPSKDQRGLDWKWIAGIGAGLLGLHLWNSYQNERRDWDNERKEMKEEIVDLKKKLDKTKDKLEEAKDEIYDLKHPIDHSLFDPMKDVAVKNALGLLRNKEKKKRLFD